VRTKERREGYLALRLRFAGHFEMLLDPKKQRFGTQVNVAQAAPYPIAFPPLPRGVHISLLLHSGFTKIFLR
jgi:hypothetical protein